MILCPSSLTTGAMSCDLYYNSLHVCMRSGIVLRYIECCLKLCSSMICSSWKNYNWNFFSQYVYSDDLLLPLWALYQEFKLNWRWGGILWLENGNFHDPHQCVSQCINYCLHFDDNTIFYAAKYWSSFYQVLLDFFPPFLEWGLF
jgi:hypothetical protein